VVEAFMSSPRARQTPRRGTRKRRTKRGGRGGGRRELRGGGRGGEREGITRGGGGDVHLYVSYTLDIHLLFTLC
jgi:hypothetical protein